jgi:hypothetical protein
MKANIANLEFREQITDAGVRAASRLGVTGLDIKIWDIKSWDIKSWDIKSKQVDQC